MVSARTKKSNSREFEQKGEYIAGRPGVGVDPGFKGSHVSPSLSPTPLPASPCVALILLVRSFLVIVRELVG